MIALTAQDINVAYLIAGIVLAVVGYGVVVAASWGWREWRDERSARKAERIDAESAETSAHVAELRLLKSMPDPEWAKPQLSMVPAPVDPDDHWDAFCNGSNWRRLGGGR